MRQTIMKSCALDGEGYCIKMGGGTLACQGKGGCCKEMGGGRKNQICITYSRFKNTSSASSRSTRWKSKEFFLMEVCAY